MISGALGTADGFPAVSPLSPAALDLFLSFDLHFPSMIDGKVEPKTPTRPALPNRKLLSLVQKLMEQKDVNLFQ